MFKPDSSSGFPISVANFLSLVARAVAFAASSPSSKALVATNCCSGLIKLLSAMSCSFSISCSCLFK
tara:strand:+ start:508 stop:708 length:201 start_codon:yes stop_codon:yes gene_type:complete